MMRTSLTPSSKDNSFSNTNLAQTIAQYVVDLVEIITYCIPSKDEKLEIIGKLINYHEKIDNPHALSQFDLYDIIDELNCFLTNVKCRIEAELKTEEYNDFNQKLRVAIETATQELYLHAMRITSYYDINVGISRCESDEETSESEEDEHNEYNDSVIDQEKEKESEEHTNSDTDEEEKYGEYSVDSDTLDLFLVQDDIQMIDKDESLDVYRQVKVEAHIRYRQFIKRLSAINKNPHEETEKEEAETPLYNQLLCPQSEVSDPLTRKIDIYFHFIKQLITYSLLVDTPKTTELDFIQKLDLYRQQLHNAINLTSKDLIGLHREIKLLLEKSIIPYVLQNIERGHVTNSKKFFQTHAAFLALQNALLTSIKKITPLKNIETGNTPDYCYPDSANEQDTKGKSKQGVSENTPTHFFKQTLFIKFTYTPHRFPLIK